MNVFTIVAHRAEFLNTVAAFVRSPACPAPVPDAALQPAKGYGGMPGARKRAIWAHLIVFLLNVRAERSIITIVDPFFARRHASD